MQIANCKIQINIYNSHLNIVTVTVNRKYTRA